MISTYTLQHLNVPISDKHGDTTISTTNSDSAALHRCQERQQMRDYYFAIDEQMHYFTVAPAALPDMDLIVNFIIIWLEDSRLVKGHHHQQLSTSLAGRPPRHHYSDCLLPNLP